MMKKPVLILLSFAIICSSFPFSAYAASTEQLKSTVISVAEGEVGYEGTSTYSKYGEWYGYQGAWCTTFAIWCFYTAGEKLGVEMYGKIVPLGGNCNSMISWFQNRGRYHERTSGYTPKRGDLVFFDWSGNGSAQHVGIVTGTSGSNVYTIEGNSSARVKEVVYEDAGDRAYRNIKKIMGYGSPDWSSVSNGKESKVQETTTAKKETTTKATTSKATTTTTERASTIKKKTTKKHTTTTETTTKKKRKKKKKKEKKTTTTETTTESTTKPHVLAKDMTIHAATTELEVGDSVKLEYAVKPKGANAVIGYFCDEENIIEISEGGVITATGEGTATVVVCANDEIYRQCDFVVSDNTAEVTRKTPVEGNIQHFTTTTEIVKSKEQILSEMGINVDKLVSHKNNFIIPLGIISVTAFVSLCIAAVKGIAKKIRRKKGNTEE